jgi:hypothetical protein
MAARFEGKPQVEWLGDGRNVKLLADIIFFDPAETRWAVPAGAVVDGASIPKILWPIVGGPFEGKYRDASIIHDWYCDKRTRTWQATHRVFYDAMLVSGVRDRKAKVMYFAVRWRGPRWEERITINTNLDVGIKFNFPGGPIQTSTFDKDDITITIKNVSNPGESFAEAQQFKIFSDIKEKIEYNDYSVDEIDALADGLKSDSSA